MDERPTQNSTYYLVCHIFEVLEQAELNKVWW